MKNLLAAVGRNSLCKISEGKISFTISRAHCTHRLLAVSDLAMFPAMQSDDDFLVVCNFEIQTNDATSLKTFFGDLPFTVDVHNVAK